MTVVMPEPMFSAGAERTYGSLAGYHRAADRTTGWQLKRWLSSMLDQYGLVDGMYQRIDYLSPDEIGADRSPLTTYTNLVPNPSFEDPSPIGGTPNNAVLERTQRFSSWTDLGTWSMVATAIADGDFGAVVSPTAIPVPDGTNVVMFSFDVLAVPGRTIGLPISFRDAAGNPISADQPEVHYTGPGFERIRTYIVLPHGTASLYLATEVLGGQAGEEMATDCLLLVAGSVPLDLPYVRYGGVITGDTSALVTPEIADDPWLPWLAQLVGVKLNLNLGRQAKIDAIRNASAGWQGGTKAGVAAAARSALTGTRYVRVFDHAITLPGNGGPWDVLVITRDSETPDPAAVLTAITAQNAKPAGVVLHHTTYSATWNTIEATYPTWAALEAAGSWTAIEEAGL